MIAAGDAAIYAGALTELVTCTRIDAFTGHAGEAVAWCHVRRLLTGPADRDSILRAVARAEHPEPPYELSTMSPRGRRSMLLVVPEDLHRRLQAEASRAGVPLVTLAVGALEMAVRS